MPINIIATVTMTTITTSAAAYISFICFSLFFHLNVNEIELLYFKMTVE